MSAATVSRMLQMRCGSRRWISSLVSHHHRCYHPLRPPSLSHPRRLWSNLTRHHQHYLTVRCLSSVSENGSSQSDKYTSVFRYGSYEDNVFDILKNKDDRVSLPKFIADLGSMGLRLDDPRLAETLIKFRGIRDTLGESGTEGLNVDRDTFRSLVSDNILLIHRAFSNELVIPEFESMCKSIDAIYWNCRARTGGKVADYIPQLSRFSPDFWGVSICTIDGQRHSIGDTRIPFCLQSCSKPLTYGIVLHELSHDVVHQYVGQEPSGESFNEIKLDPQRKPHNPMINAGAIIIASLVKNNMSLPDRFDFISRQYRRMTGGEYLGFNNAVCLSERETADRNFALGYYMRENKCFPNGTNFMDVMDLYFQMCSVEVTCDSASVIAATLANGGICPTTMEKILDSGAVRNTLSLMHSCGMYDYSGQFAFTVGLPAKSGVSGAILLVVPNVMGICMWSPPLDSTGNSVRGLNFCKELVERFNFHNYDNLRHTPLKADPRKRKSDSQSEQIMTLLFSAYNGDLNVLKRLALKGTDMMQRDYDGRTALHVAAAEGHINCVNFLLEKCAVHPEPKDRWGHTPLDDAVKFGHEEVVTILESSVQKWSSEQG